MRSIKARFNVISEKNPYWSSVVSFTEAIRSQNFSKDMILRWFNKIVKNDDYSRENKKGILKNIYKANKEEYKPKEKHNFIPKYYSK